MSVGDRGKKSEAEVKKLLKQYESEFLRFTFNRVLDARAARGKFPAQAGDYQAFHLVNSRPRNFILEVKEVAHDFRLPHKNYEEAKVNRVRKRQLAGTECLVLVYSSTQEKWRAIEFDFFVHREGGSWDLRPFPFVELDFALREFFGMLEI